MKILIPAHIYQKLRAYVMTIDKEISGLGRLSHDGKGLFLVEEIRIFKQTVTGGSTVLDKKDLAVFYDELIQSGGDPSEWKLWWHSHGIMDVFWSDIDTRTIEDFDNEMEADNWMLSLETNQAGKVITRLDIYKPLRITLDDIEWDITFENNEKLLDEVFVEVAEKVKIAAPSNHRRKEQSNHNGHPTYSYPGKTPTIGSLLDGSPFPEDRPIQIIMPEVNRSSIQTDHGEN